MSRPPRVVYRRAPAPKAPAPRAVPALPSPRSAPSPCAPAWRAPALMLLCALALFLLALAPAALLRLADLAQMGQVRQVAQPYVSQPLDKEDFYLLRMLEQWQEDQATTDSDLFHSELTPSPSVGFYALSVLQQMADAGVIPEVWFSRLTGLLLQDPAGHIPDLSSPAMAEGEAGQDLQPLDDLSVSLLREGFANAFYYRTDNLGFISVYAVDERGEPLFYLLAEGRTWQPVCVWLAGGGMLDEPEAQPRLANWLRMNGLDALGDWEVPQGTCYADIGLYSARGGVLALCSGGVPAARYDIYPHSGSRPDGLLLALFLSGPPARLQGEARLAPPAVRAAGARLYPLDITRGGCLGGDRGDVYYEWQPDSDGWRLVYTDLSQPLAAGKVLCRRAHCAHDTAACPARAAWPSTLFWAGGALYRLRPLIESDVPSWETLSMAGWEDVYPYSGGFASLRLLQRYLGLPDRMSFAVERLDGDAWQEAGRLEDIALEGKGYFFFHDDAALYAIEGGAGGEAALLCLGLSGGGAALSTPLPADSVGALAAVQGLDGLQVYGDRLLVALSRPSIPFGMDPLSGVRVLSQGADAWAVAWDPFTDACEQLAVLEEPDVPWAWTTSLWQVLADPAGRSACAFCTLLRGPDGAPALYGQPLDGGQAFAPIDGPAGLCALADTDGLCVYIVLEYGADEGFRVCLWGPSFLFTLPPPDGLEGYGSAPVLLARLDDGRALWQWQGGPDGAAWRALADADTPLSSRVLWSWIELPPAGA